VADQVVDILVLTYNHLKVTKDFLTNLFKHTRPGSFRLWILDNGSIDGTPDYLLATSLQHMDCMKFVTKDENLGIVKGRNELYRIASEQDDGQLFLFLDNDQIPRKGWLEEHLMVLNKGYDVVGVEAWLFDKNLYPIERIRSLGRPFNYVGCGGMLIRKRVIDEIGLFDEEFSPAFFEDPDFCFRCATQGFRIGWNYKAKITHLEHVTLGGNIIGSEKAKTFLSSYKKFREKWLGKAIPYIQQEFIPELSTRNRR